MNELNGPFVVIVLSIGDGRGFDFLQRPMRLEGTLEKNIIVSDPVLPVSSPSICTEFVWETQKKEIRRLRSSQISIRVTCYTTDLNGKQEKIGLTMLNLRTAQPIPNNLIQTVDFKWHKLLHVPSCFKSFHPAICLQLTIRDKINHEAEFSDVSITPSIEQLIQGAEVANGNEKLIAPIYLEEGWIQLGNKKEECQKYFLRFIVGTAMNLDLLLDKDQVFNKQNQGYYLAISILGLQINTKFFYKHLHEPVCLNDKIIIKLLTNPKLLNQIFNELEKVPIYFYYGSKILATANINLKELLNTKEENNFLNNQNCEFHLEENNKMHFGTNDRKPYVSIETKLELCNGKFDTTIVSSSNDSVKLVTTENEQTETSINEETVDSFLNVETKIDERTSESSINNTEKNMVSIMIQRKPSSTSQSMVSNESDNKSLVTGVQEFGVIEEIAEEEYPSDIPQKVESDNIEIKFHLAREVYTSESELQTSESNQAFSEDKKTATSISLDSNVETDVTTPLVCAPKTQQLSPKQLRAELGNYKVGDTITITTPDGEKIMKTVNSLLMESLKACGDTIACTKNKAIKELNLIMSKSEDVAVQTTPRVLNVAISAHSLLQRPDTRKTPRILTSFDCPRDDYRLYRMEVIFRSITWRQNVHFDGFQFKINHPKATNSLVITCDLKEIQYNKDNILLDDVYFNLYFISQEENILHLTAMYPPKISVQSLSDHNLVEDFDLYTKLMLNQGTRECNYFAVPNSLWDADDIVCDIQIDMKIHTVDTTVNLFKSQFDLEPIVLDDWFALKTLSELDEWKQKQEILFQDNLKRTQCKKLELLQAEWNVKRMELEIKLQAGLEKCKALALELTTTADKYRLKKKTIDESEDMQLKVTQLLEEEMKQTIRRLENEKYELLKSIEQLKYEKTELENNIRIQSEALDEMRKNTLSKEQTKLVFIELRNLEEKFNNALMEKAFFKEEWHKALKEAHALKAADQRSIQQEIQKNKDELNHLSLDQLHQIRSNETSEEETDENYESLKILQVPPYIYY